jgi:hypothetical protein
MSTYLWWVTSTPDHFLQHLRANLLLRLAHTNSHIREQWVVADVGSTAVALDVGQPLVLGRVGVTGADVAGLQGLEVLESAELVGHFGGIGELEVFLSVRREKKRWYD